MRNSSAVLILFILDISSNHMKIHNPYKALDISSSYKYVLYPSSD